MQRVAPSQIEFRLIGVAGGEAEIGAVDRQDAQTFGGEAQKGGRSRGAVLGLNAPARSLIDNAEENSVSVQSLIARLWTSCRASQS